MTAGTAGTEPTVPRPPRTVGRTVVAVVGLLLMLPVGFFYLTSGLVVPGPWIFVLWVLFLALLLAAVQLARRRSWWVPAVPAAAFALWMLLLTLGERLLGWQA
jgi:hypothetical protein